MGQGSSRDGAPSGGSADTTPKPPARPSLGPDGGHLVSVSGVYLDQDADLDVVAALIHARKLAPFYRGLDELPDGEPGREAIEAALNEVAQPKANDDDRRKAALALLPNRRSEPERHRRAEALAYIKHGTVDCTICFLVYPANVNMTRCCDSQICTECFTQIKRADPTPQHLVSEPVSCPFCVEPEFGVTYDPPAPALQRTPSGSRAFAPAPDRPAIERSASSASGSGIVVDTPPPTPGRRKSRSASEPSVVTVDRIHPNWEAKLEAARATAARRAARRIVFRRAEGGRLVPVGITSARDIAAAAYAAEHGPSAEEVAAAQATSGRRSGRRRPTDGSTYLQSLGMSGADLEELMIAEAMRLSVAFVVEVEMLADRSRDEEERQRKDQAAKKAAASAPAAAMLRPDASGPGPATTATSLATSPPSDNPLPPIPDPDASQRRPSTGASTHRSRHSSLGYAGPDTDSVVSFGESTVPLRPRPSQASANSAS